MQPRVRTQTLNTLRERRDEIVRLAAAHGGSNVRVFGSVARGEDDEQSDIDLLVEFDRDVDALEYFSRIDELGRVLTERLGRKVDVIDAGALKQNRFRIRSEEKMRQRILAEAVPL